MKLTQAEYDAMSDDELMAQLEREMDERDAKIRAVDALIVNLNEIEGD